LIHKTFNRDAGLGEICRFNDLKGRHDEAFQQKVKWCFLEVQ
jgi:hypothetical protein